MICSKHVDVKRHSMCFPEIEKTFAVSSLVLNLFASQIGEFFLPHPVVQPEGRSSLIYFVTEALNAMWKNVCFPVIEDISSNTY